MGSGQAGPSQAQCLEMWFSQQSLRTDRMLGSGIHEEGGLRCVCLFAWCGHPRELPETEHILGDHCPCHLPRTNMNRNDLNLASSWQ